MALARARRSESPFNYWPGFVDALSTLVLSIIFLLTVFMVAQFFLSQQISGKDTALARLSAQISRLSELLSLERTGKTTLEAEIAQLRASLSAVEGERDRMRDAAEGAQSNHDAVWHAGGVSSRSRLEDHVERCLRGASNISEATGSSDLAQFCLAGLRAECGADLLRQ